MLVHELLIDTSARTPGARALIAGDESRTFEDIDRDSDLVSCALQDAGIRRGDRVAVMLQNCPEFVVSVFGVLKAGGVFVPVDPTVKTAKLAYVLSQCEVSGLIAHAGLERVVTPALGDAPTVSTALWLGGVPPEAPFGRALEDVLAEPTGRPADPSLIDADLAGIIYTSGSTGLPKGVMLTHRNICHNAWSISTYLGLAADDVVACLLPLSFGYGLFHVFMGARVGFTVVLEQSFAYPYDVLKRIEEHRVTVLPGVPTIFATLLGMAPFDGLDLSALRMLTNAAAALPPAHIVRLQELFPHARLFSMYGLTECTRVCYLDPDRLHDKVSSVGKAMPNTEAYIVDELGRRVPPGVIGELVVRGASVMRGYWQKPEATSKHLRDGELEGEKVLYTGDQFMMDDEGFLYFVGRTDDIFMCRGEKISPKEIEDVLYELEGVGEAAVIGVPDPIDGMTIKAIVVPRGDSALTEQQIRLHCRERLETSRMPKLVELSESFPKSGSGKILKDLLVDETPA